MSAADCQSAWPAYSGRQEGLGQVGGSLGRCGAEAKRHLPRALPDSVFIRTDWGESGGWNITDEAAETALGSRRGQDGWGQGWGDAARFWGTCAASGEVGGTGEGQGTTAGPPSLWGLALYSLPSSPVHQRGETQQILGCASWASNRKGSFKLCPLRRDSDGPACSSASQLPPR